MPDDDPLCLCGHPKSQHVAASPVQLVCIAHEGDGPDEFICGCLEFETSDFSDVDDNIDTPLFVEEAES